MSQGSVLGPIVINIYLNDLFYLVEVTNVCNFADNTTIYASDSSLHLFINRLEHDASIAVEWFENDFRKLNQKIAAVSSCRERTCLM